MEFNLRDTTGGQGVTNCHQTDSLITGIKQCHVHHVVMHFQVATAMDDLEKNDTKTSLQLQFQKKAESSRKLKIFVLVIATWYLQNNSLTEL